MSTLLRFRGPWKGIVSRRPPVLLQPNEAVSTNNVVFFDEVLQKGPPWFVFTTDLRSALPIMFATDPGSGWGLYFDLAKFYKQIAAWPNNWDGGTAVTGGVNGFVSLESTIYNNTLYYSNGTVGNPNQVGTYDGAVLTIAAATYVGGIFLNQLVDHLVLGYCTNAGVTTKNRVSWSASGLPLVWDPAVNVNAGFNDLLMVNDYITGIGQLDQYLLIYSHTGIQWMIPTGSGLKPFDFRPFANSKDNTIGNFYPQSRDGNGQMEFFVSQYDVQMLTLNGLSNIGGEARTAIFADIANIPAGSSYTYSSGSNYNDLYPIVPSDPVIIGSCIPAYDRLNIYPLYILTIPYIDGTGSRNTVVWIYEVDRDRWTRTVIVGSWITTKIKPVGARTAVTPAQYSSNFLSMFGFYQNVGGVGKYYIGYAQGANNNVSSSPTGMSYTFPTAETDGKFLTVTRLRFMYKDEAVQTGAVINFTATYSDESGTVYTASSSVTINYLGDGIEKQVYVDFQFSGLLSSLQMSSNANPYMISLEVIGTGQELDVM